MTRCETCNRPTHDPLDVDHLFSPAATCHDVDHHGLDHVENGEGYDVYRDAFSVVVHLHMVKVGPWTEAYIVSSQKADALARKVDASARLLVSTEYGVTAADHTRRVYAITESA